MQAKSQGCTVWWCHSQDKNLAFLILRPGLSFQSSCLLPLWVPAKWWQRPGPSDKKNSHYVDNLKKWPVLDTSLKSCPFVVWLCNRLPRGRTFSWLLKMALPGAPALTISLGQRPCGGSGASGSSEQLSFVWNLAHHWVSYLRPVCWMVRAQGGRGELSPPNWIQQACSPASTRPPQLSPAKPLTHKIVG